MLTPALSEMPQAKSRLASYFDDDEPTTVRGGSASRRGDTRQSRRNDAGYQRGLGDGEEEATAHATKHTHEVKHTGATDKPKDHREELKESLKETKLKLNKKLNTCDEFVISHPTWPGSDIIDMIHTHRTKLNAILLDAKDQWTEDNEPKFKANDEAKAHGKPKVYKNFFWDKKTHLHSKTVPFPDIDEITHQVDTFVKKHGVFHEGTDMKAFKPKEAPHGHHEYYIYNVLRFLSREKYRVVQSMHKYIHDKWAEHQGTPQGTEYRHYLDMIRDIKALKDKSETILKQIRAIPSRTHRKTKKEPRKLPDSGYLPKQAPSGI